MKVFVSHPMHGKTDEEVEAIRSDALKYLKAIYGNDITLIDNYHHDNAPKDAGRLWHLGASIQQMETADAFYFCGDYKKSYGCLVERLIVMLYDLKLLK